MFRHLYHEQRGALWVFPQQRRGTRAARAPRARARPAALPVSGGKDSAKLVPRSALCRDEATLGFPVSDMMENADLGISLAAV